MDMHTCFQSHTWGTILLLFLFLPHVSAGQSIELTVNDSTLVLSESNLTASSQARPFPRTGSFELRVDCVDGLDCTTLSSQLVGVNEPQSAEPTASNESSLTFLFDAGAWPASERSKETVEIQIQSSNAEGVVAFPVYSSPPEVTRGSNSSTSIPSLNSLLTADCRPELEAARRKYSTEPKDGYSEAANRGVFVISPAGNVVFRPGPVIDENDEIFVVVVSQPAVGSRLTVRRTSAFRMPGTLNIVGAGATIPAEAFQSMSAAGQRMPCTEHRFQLSDFAPGQATVQVSVLADEGEVTTGSFDFGVNTLYRGAFGLGAFKTNLEDHTFGLVDVNDETIITRTGGAGPRLLYVVTYTPFIWGERDLEKERLGSSDFFTRRGPIRSVNPTFGVALNDISKNAFVAASIDFVSSIYIHLGYHFGHITRFDSSTGVTLGDPFEGTVDDIPTVNKWAGAFTWGVTLDLRAATMLLRTALTAGS